MRFVTLIILSLISYSSGISQCEICEGEDMELCYSDITGTAVSYSWNIGETTECITVMPTTATTYEVTVTDANGCTFVTDIEVEVVPAPEVICRYRLGLDPYQTDADCYLEICDNQRLVVAGNTMAGGNSWTITQPDGTVTTNFSLVINPVTVANSGVYIIEATSPEGCVTTEEFEIIVLPPCEINATVTNPACMASTGAIDITVSSGTAPYTYSWSNGAITEDISGLAAGSYTVEVTDANGCVCTETFDLTDEDGPEVNCNSYTYCASAGTLEVTFDISNGSPSYNWQIQSPNGNNVASGTATSGGTINPPAVLTNPVAGTYTIEVTDTNGCIATCSFEITVSDLSGTIECN